MTTSSIEARSATTSFLPLGALIAERIDEMMASSGFSKKNSKPSRSRSRMSVRTWARNSSTPFHGRGMFWPRMRPAHRPVAAAPMNW